MPVATALPASPRSFRRALLWGGATAGVLDICAAAILTVVLGGNVLRMLRGIASAVLGPVSMDLGLATAALGLLLHFAIAFTWTGLFLALGRRLPFLLRQPLAAGLGWGSLVYLGMYRVVLPLAALARSLYLANVDQTLPRLTLRMWLIHLGCVGLPIALAAWRFAPRDAAATGGDALEALAQPDRAS